MVSNYFLLFTNTYQRDINSAAQSQEVVHCIGLLYKLVVKANQKAVSVYSTSKQILPVGVADHNKVANSR